MRWLGLLGVAGGLLVLGACGSKINGEWKGDCETEDEAGNDYDYNIDLEIVEKGGDIEGSSDWESDDQELDGDIEGEKDGDDIEFDVELDGDFGSGEAEFKLKLKDGDLVGDIDIDYDDFNDESGECKFKKK